MRMPRLTKLPTIAAAAVLLAGPAFANGVTDDRVLLGMHQAMSGPVAYYGVAAVAAANIRFEAANAAGGVHGRKIEMIVEDTQYQVPLAVKAVNKLIDHDGVFALFGSIGTSHHLATKERVFAAGVPVLFPYTGAEVVKTPTERLKITWGSSYADQVRAAVEHLSARNGRKSMCVMYQDNDFGQEALEAARAASAEFGVPVLAEASHRPDATEFVGTMTRFKSAGCDMVVMGTMIRDSIIAYATARELGIEADMATTLAAADTVVSSAEGGVTEGLFSFSLIDVPYADNAPDTAKPFFDAYIARHGKDPGVPAILGYIWADLMVKGLENAGPDLTVDSLIEGFEKIEAYVDPFGNAPLTYSAENHNGVREVVPLVVKSGRWTRLD